MLLTRRCGTLAIFAFLANWTEVPVKTGGLMAAKRPESLALDATGVIICPDPGTAQAARSLSTFAAAARVDHGGSASGRLRKRRDSHDAGGLFLARYL
jgi:hypothetical protein